MKIAACLITRNSEKTLEQCLASVRPFVDGVFIYDTGSEDGTFDLVGRLNERQAIWAHTETGRLVEQSELEVSPGNEYSEIPLAPITIEKGEWRDDFAWARQQSFDMAPDEYEWRLWLDDDDIIHGGPWLRQLAHTCPPDIDGFVVYYDYARDEAGNTVCQLWRERLIRRSAGYTWKLRVHEVLTPPDGRPPMLAMVPPEQLRYVHHRELAGDRYQPDRNLRLLRLEAEEYEKKGEQPDPRTLAYIGTELMGRGEQTAFAEAVPWFERYLQHPDAGFGDERSQVHHKLATCLRFLGQADAAVEVEFRALRERDDWAETYVGLAEAFAGRGDWARAERWARRALETWELADQGVRRTPLIINPLEFTFLPYVRLSEVCINTGRYDEALGWLEKAATVAPQHPIISERRPLYEQARFEGELVTAMLKLREVAVRHDENLKALELLEAAPYVIRDHPAIIAARVAQRENCRHYLDPDEYRRWYSEEPKESTVTDEFVPRAGEVFHRVGLLEAGLVEQETELGRKPTVLDLGCNDFWMGAYLMTKGYDVDGVELNRKSYELALERAERFATNGDAPIIVHGDLHDAATLLGKNGGYDAVSLFEVIEHVPDPAATLAACEKLLNPGGRIYISTPDGAYEKGNLDRWHVIERKGHLRAWPVWEFADQVSARGEIRQLDLGQGLAVVSYTPARRKGKVVFYAGGCFEKWQPNQHMTTGLGGSETALVQVATRLARAGWHVKCYADVDPMISPGGVIWRPHTAWDPMEQCDAMIVSRIPAAFDAPMRAPVRALWCHDHSYPGLLTEDRASKLTHVIVLSEWQRARFARLYPHAADKLVIVRNGVTLQGVNGDDRFPNGNRPFGDRKPRCVYSSSADRGLDVLLELWPRIRKKVPGAELHVYYGFDILEKVALAGNPGLLEYKQRVLQLAEAAGGEGGGVFLRGRTPQPQLYEEMQEARVWSYPTAFLETSCIGAMEARAAGLAIVTSELGALRETVSTHGQLIPWCADEDEPENRKLAYQDAFVAAVVRLLSDEEAWAGWHRRARAGVRTYDWDTRLAQWEAVCASGRPAKRKGRARGARRKAAVAA